MSDNKDKFITKFNRFGKRSIDWSISESENEITNITDTLQIVMDDVDRRSKMSKETYELLGGLQDRFKEVAEQRQLSINKVVNELTDLGNDHREMDELVRPLIFSLQFQDRIRQMLENSAKVAAYWQEKRKTFEKGPVSKEELLKIGQELLKLTICHEERTIVRKYIKDLPEETRPVQNTILF